VAVEVLSGSVVAHGGAGVGMACGDLDVAEVDAGVEHGGDVGVTEHVRMHPWGGDAGGVSELAQSSCGAVAGHSCTAPVAEDRTVGLLANGAVDRSSHGGWKWDRGELVALPADGQDAVWPWTSPVADIGTGGFEDAQAEESEHCYQSEVATLSRVAGGGQECLELKMAEPKSRGLD